MESFKEIKEMSDNYYVIDGVKMDSKRFVSCKKLEELKGTTIWREEDYRKDSNNKNVK